MKEYKYITVVQKDLLENKETVVFKGNAKVSIDDKHSIKYEENDSTSVEISMTESGGFLERNGEVSTRINFQLDEDTHASIITDVGEIRMGVNTEEITLKNNNLVLAYSLTQESNTVSKFYMKVEWENE